MTEKCCGTCRYCEYDRKDGEWFCNCEDSEAYVLQTVYSDSCEEWEER